MTRIGIQISSVRPYLQTPEDVLASFRKVSVTGCRLIQIQWIAPTVPADFIRDALAQAQLTCIGTQDYYDVVVSHLDEFIAMNELWSGRYVCVSGIPERYQSLAGCLAFAEELNRLSERLEKQGMVLNFHPRAADVLQFEGKNALEIILANTLPPFQFLLDVYHLVKAGLDPIEWIYKVKGRNDLIHFKDMTTGLDGKEALMPVGQGRIAWKAVFQACRDTGIRYAFAEQETWQKDPFECLKESYDYIIRHGFGQ